MPRKAAIALAALFALVAAAAAQPLEKVRVGMPSPALAFVAPKVAHAKGFFAAEGMEVELIQMAANVSVAALMNKDIDYSTATGGMLRSAVQGRPVRILMYFNRRPLYVLVVRPEIRRIDDLKGKVVGFTGYGDTTEFMLKAILQLANMEMEKDIRVLPIANAGPRLAALLSGKVDATLIPPPFNLEAEAKGFRRLIEASEVLEATSSGLGSTADKLKTRPEQALRMIRALLRSQAFMKSNKSETVRILSDWLKYDPAMAAECYDIYLRAVSLDGLVGEKTIQFNIERAREALKLSESVPLDRVVDFTILRRALMENR